MGNSFSQEKFLKASDKEIILDGQVIDLQYTLLNEINIDRTNNLLKEKNDQGQTLLHQVR
jgi:hypothetical protein